MIRFLITGSSGFIGRHLINTAEVAEIDVEVLKYSKRDGCLTLPVRGIPIVIHLAGRAHVLNETSASPYEEFHKANCDFAVRVAKAASKQGLKRFVYVSSIGVYGKSRSPNSIVENSALEPVEDYARSKLEAERKLTVLSKELGFELVIVRPALVYGFDAPGNIERLLTLTSKLPVIPIAERNNRRSFVYVENLVDFLLLAATHPNAAGKSFNIADNAISTCDLIDGFAKGMGRSPLLFSFPRVFWKALLRIAGKQKMYEQLFEDLVLDMSLAETELGWKPKHDTATALQVTGKQFLHVKQQSRSN